MLCIETNMKCEIHAIYCYFVIKDENVSKRNNEAVHSVFLFSLK